MSSMQREGTELRRPKAPWEGTRGLASVLDGWRSDAGVARCFSLDAAVPAKPADLRPIPEELAPGIRAALEARGVRELYSHQVAAYEHARAGRDFVVATPTASGKSLCFHLPVLDALARDPSARAIYLYPTKALSRDQEASLHTLMRDAGLSHGAITYDGDTPGDARRAAKEKSAVLLTNPDMLHAGILPHHASWARVFSKLTYVVVDEVHSYRGVFGSHLANVLRRLQRIAAFHGSSPKFLFASATIGNPREHASRIAGRPVELVGESGAPTGARKVLVYNPPVVNPELGMRASYVKSAVKLTADLVRAGVSTILFGQSRNSVEVMLKYLRDRLVADKIDPDVIHAYRGGYLPETRRNIEAQLRDGQIKCVVSTSALELGIDIGALDAVVCAGYPGSVAGLWQRFGRAGRRSGQSLALLVTSSAPLDQYFAKDPKALLSGGVEEARIDPDNVEILVQHLKCAAFELPFEVGDTFGDVPAQPVEDALSFLAKHELLHAAPGPRGKDVFHWASDAYPANHVSLRSVGWDNFVIIDVERDKTIAEMDWRSTHTMLHVQAIYQHEGEQYQVERLDYENHKAFVRKVAPDYYTDAMTHTRVTILDPANEGPAYAQLSVGMGEVSVIEKVVGYKKIKFHTHENVGYGDVHLPEMQMQTTSCWFTVPEDVVTSMPYPRPTVVDAVRAMGQALHTVACVGLMVDPRDLGRTTGSRSDPDSPPSKSVGGGPGFDPTVFLYDHVPGGVGLATRIYEERETLLRRARRIVEGCACDDGCPACFGPEVGQTAAAESVLPVRRRVVVLELMTALGVPREQ